MENIGYNERNKTMTREQLKIMLPIMQAFAEGKTLQYRVNKENNEWKDIDNPSFYDAPSEYRIKPEPKYRPFKNKEECWNEMMKHKLFGLVITKDGSYVNILSVSEENFNDWFSYIKFTDGTPFGIKKE